MDAKFGFDDNADFRQKDVFGLRDVTQEDAQEVEAAEVTLPCWRVSGLVLTML
jgi:succinyl-CoA synthetase beta subunit